jgi:hypothetical protein
MKAEVASIYVLCEIISFNNQRTYVIPDKRHTALCVAIGTLLWPPLLQFEDSAVVFSPVCGLSVSERSAAGCLEFGLSE